MGILTSRAWKRNDNIEGQGKDLLITIKNFNITTYEMNRIFIEYSKYENKKLNLINIELFYEYYNIKYNFFDSILFKIYDQDKRNLINFEQFLIGIWNFLTMDEYCLANLCFDIFDQNR